MTETMFRFCSPEQEAVLEEKERKLSELREVYDDLDNIGVRLFGLREDGTISKAEFDVIAWNIDRAMEQVEKLL